MDEWMDNVAIKIPFVVGALVGSEHEGQASATPVDSVDDRQRDQTNLG